MIRTLLLACALALCSCGQNNPGPQVVNNESHQASFDGTTQNSGILSQWPEGAKDNKVLGFHVTPHFRLRYNALVAKYGTRFMPPIVQDQGLTPFPDGTWLVNQQAMVWFLDMNQWQRNGAAPAK